MVYRYLIWAKDVVTDFSYIYSVNDITWLRLEACCEWTMGAGVWLHNLWICDRYYIPRFIILADGPIGWRLVMNMDEIPGPRLGKTAAAPQSGTAARDRRSSRALSRAFCFGGCWGLSLIHAATFSVSRLISEPMQVGGMEKMCRQSTVIPGFLPPAPHGVLKSLLENPQQLPLHHHGEPGRKRPLSVTAGCLCGRNLIMLAHSERLVLKQRCFNNLWSLLAVTNFDWQSFGFK